MRAQTFKWLFFKTLKSADSPIWRSTGNTLKQHYSNQLR